MLSLAIFLSITTSVDARTSSPVVTKKSMRVIAQSYDLKAHLDDRGQVALSAQLDNDDGVEPGSQLTPMVPLPQGPAKLKEVEDGLLQSERGGSSYGQPPPQQSYAQAWQRHLRRISRHGNCQAVMETLGCCREEYCPEDPYCTWVSERVTNFGRGQKINPNDCTILPKKLVHCWHKLQGTCDHYFRKQIQEGKLSMTDAELEELLHDQDIHHEGKGQDHQCFRTYLDSMHMFCTDTKVEGFWLPAEKSQSNPEAPVIEQDNSSTALDETLSGKRSC